jgi:positive regulator of sigma E activity
MAYRNAETGTVVATAEGKATVELNPNSGCKACGLCTCGAGGKMLLQVEAPAGLAVGQAVLVADASPSAWLGSFVLFVLPPVGLVAGLMVGGRLFAGRPSAEALSAALGIAGLALCFGVGVVVERIFRRRPQPQPRIVQVRPLESDEGS